MIFLVSNLTRRKLTWVPFERGVSKVRDGEEGDGKTKKKEKAEMVR